jgi:heme A synthase
MLALNAMTGASVSGNNAGRTWGGNLVPDFSKMFPNPNFISNFFENSELALTDHRLMGYLTFLYSAFLLTRSYMLKLPGGARLGSFLLFTLVGLQLANGILSLHNKVPLLAGTYH